MQANLRADYPRIQFIASTRLPSLIWKAAKSLGYDSSTAYIQDVLCKQVAEDLGLDAEELKAELPERRRHNASPVYWNNKHKAE